MRCTASRSRRTPDARPTAPSVAIELGERGLVRALVVCLWSQRVDLRGNLSSLLISNSYLYLRIRSIFIQVSLFAIICKNSRFVWESAKHAALARRCSLRWSGQEFGLGSKVCRRCTKMAQTALATNQKLTCVNEPTPPEITFGGPHHTNWRSTSYKLEIICGGLGYLFVNICD